MKKVVIIWAGPAGLTAAYELSKIWDFEIVILEMSNTVWGLSQTAQYKWNKIDIWGHRFFSKSDEVMQRRSSHLPLQWSVASDYKALWIEVPVSPGWPDPDKEDKVMLIRNRLSRLFFDWKFFDYPPSLKYENLKNLWILRVFKIVFSYIMSKFQKFDESHLEWFYKRKFWELLYDLFFKDYTKKLWWRDPNKIDASWWAQRVKWVSISKIFIDIYNKLRNKSTKDNTETSLISQFWYPKFGPGHMRETVWDSCLKNGVSILYNAKVVSFNQWANWIIEEIIYECWWKKEWICVDIVISTMPIKYLMRWLNKADYQIKEYANSLEYRDFITVWVLLKKSLIANKTNIPTVHGSIPDNRIYVHDKNADFLRMQIFNNRSPYMVEDDNNLWVGLEYICAEWDHIWSQSDNELMKNAIIQLQKIWISSSEDVIDMTVIRMKKAYPAYFGDWYDHFSEIQSYLDSIDNLYCIGRNGMHRYNNQDHSVLCALECTKKIIVWDKDKTDLWKINTEKEYHEEVKIPNPRS